MSFQPIRTVRTRADERRQLRLVGYTNGGPRTMLLEMQQERSPVRHILLIDGGRLINRTYAVLRATSRHGPGTLPLIC